MVVQKGWCLNAASTRARGDGGLRRAVASTAVDCMAQVIECCVGRACVIRRSAVTREARPTIAGSARVRVLPARLSVEGVAVIQASGMGAGRQTLSG